MFSTIYLLVMRFKIETFLFVSPVKLTVIFNTLKEKIDRHLNVKKLFRTCINIDIYAVVNCVTFFWLKI
jgi:hypothetical protein